MTSLRFSWIHTAKLVHLKLLDTAHGQNQEIKSLLIFAFKNRTLVNCSFQSEHLNILIGAGLSSAIQESATGTKPQGMGWINDLKVCKAEIDSYVAKTAEASGRGRGNIEDQIRSINELIKGLEILTAQNLPLPEPPPGALPYRNLKVS